MASPTSALSVCCPPSCVTSIKPTIYSLSSSSHSCFKVKALNFSLTSRFYHMGMGHFTCWNGLNHTGISSISANPQKLGRRERKCKGMVVYASLFGVGAPELLVIGVVALMVFGPKGLAEVARSLGKTLREFQPTIKELQEVSREFKSTLEREIGIDDVPSAVRKTNESRVSDSASSQSVSRADDSQTASVAETNGAPTNNVYSSENSNINEEKVSVVAHQDAISLPPESQTEIDDQPQDSVENTNSGEDDLKITEELL